jgi:uncharacterized protein YndB with AHSA1/START domain
MPDIVVTRIFDASAQQVWDAWTEPEQVMRWWGPQGFSSPTARMDVREGGRSLVCMRSPDGHDMYNTWTYSHVAEPERLEFTMGFADADGNPLDPVALGLPPDIPHPVEHVVQIRDSDGTTELTVTERGYADDGPTYQLSKTGLEQCLDKMASSLAG